MNNGYEAWIERAESSLALGKTKRDGNIVYEDLCFQLQQACEKILKAYLIFLNVLPPKTHSFKILIKLVSDKSIYPKELNSVIDLEDYAVQTRYPGDYSPVSSDEYEEALKITENLFSWVKSMIK